MRHVLFCVLLVTGAPAAVAAPAPFTKPVRLGSDLERMQGEWEWIGTSGPFFVREDRVHWFGRQVDLLTDTIRLYPETSPKGIDLTHDGILKLGIYRIDGDTLTIRISHHYNGRPPSFDGECDCYVGCGSVKRGQGKQFLEYRFRRKR